MDMWRERLAERGLPEPDDLSDSCIFTSLLASLAFGGEIRGNHAHFHVRLPDKTVVDLNEDAADVAAIRDRGSNPYSHWRSLMRSRVVRDQIESCRPRVEQWLPVLLRRLDEIEAGDGQPARSDPPSGMRGGSSVRPPENLQHA